MEEEKKKRRKKFYSVPTQLTKGKQGGQHRTQPEEFPEGL